MNWQGEVPILVGLPIAHPISESARRMPENEALTETVLSEVLPLVNTVLVDVYRFMPEEAEAFKETLSTWFRRITRRAGSRETAIEELRGQLIYVACKYARAIQIGKFGIPGPDTIAEALRRDPDEMAFQILQRVRPEVSRS